MHVFHLDTFGRFIGVIELKLKKNVILRRHAFHFCGLVAFINWTACVPSDLAPCMARLSCLTSPFLVP